MDIITLLDDYVRGLLEAEEVFLTDLGQFPRLEQTVSDLSRRMATGFLSLVLTNADEMIRSSGLRNTRYTVQRRVDRTLISTMGDITFQETVFQDRKTKGYRRLLGEMLRLPVGVWVCAFASAPEAQGLLGRIRSTKSAV